MDKKLKQQLLRQLSDIGEFEECCEKVPKLEHPYPKFLIPDEIHRIMSRFPKQERYNLIKKYLYQK